MNNAQNNYKWFLVGEDDSGQTVKYTCPNVVVGDIIKILFEQGQGEMCSPTEEVIEHFEKLLGSKVITLEMVSQLTGLSEPYLERLKNGTIEEAETQKIVKLVEIIEKGKG